MGDPVKCPEIGCPTQTPDATRCWVHSPRVQGSGRSMFLIRRKDLSIYIGKHERRRMAEDATPFQTKEQAVSLMKEVQRGTCHPLEVVEYELVEKGVVS